MRKETAALLCIMLLYGYAGLIGFLHFPPALVVQDLLLWLPPLIFALVLSLQRALLLEAYAALETAFLGGLLVVGAYGVYQFFFLPPWDVLWMEQMKLDSIGVAEPMKARVFSTMNSPQVTASFLAIGMLILFNSRHRLRFLAMPIALLSLVLSQARSGWIALLTGMLYLIVKLPRKQKVQLVIAAVLCSAGLLLALENPDLQEVVTKRFNTISSGKSDVSYMDRVTGYEAVIFGFLDDPYGLGMGATPAVAQGLGGFFHNGFSLVLGDSTLLMVLTTMGAAGAFILAGAVFPLTTAAFLGPASASTRTLALRAGLVGLGSEAALDGVIAAPTGFLTWAAFGFCLAIYHSHREQPAAVKPVLRRPAEQSTSIPKRAQQCK